MDLYLSVVRLPVSTGWGLDEPAAAERAVAEQPIALALVGRAHLANPHYPFRAARELGVPKSAELLPEPYAYWLARYPGPPQAAPVD